MNSKNLINAINTYAVPVLTYSFGILKYSDTDLNELDRMTRTTFTKFRIHHPKSAIQRLYLSREEGGRGLINIYQLCRSQENNMRLYFHNSDNALLRRISEVDENYSALNLNNRQGTIQDNRTKEEAQLTWQNKTLHGKYPNLLNNPVVDKTTSLMWLKEGYLHPETEGFIIAIQDCTIRTRNYEKYILKSPETIDICRMCNSPGETIEHITAGCPCLSNTAYLGRHNEIAKVIHRQLALKYNLINNPPPFYKYLPAAVLESNDIVLYWDRPIITDRTVDFNRPDIVIIDKTNKSATLVDIGCPLTNNLQKTEREKVIKYQNLAIEIRHIWELNDVRIIPIIISATGVVTKHFVKHLDQLNIPKGLIKTIQKAAILQTCHIVRKFLNA